MNSALYDAIYVDFSAFQWVHFTPFGIVAGRVSKAHWYLDEKKKVRKDLLKYIAR